MEEIKKHDLGKRLDASLEIALAMHDLGYTETFFSETGRAVKKGEIGYFPNRLVEGPTGTGKTVIIRDWAQKNEINLVPFYVPTYAAYAREEQKTVVLSYLQTEGFKEALSKSRSVLFLEHYEDMTAEIESALAELMDEHVLPSGDDKIFMPELLFVIAEETTGRNKD